MFTLSIQLSAESLNTLVTIASSKDMCPIVLDSDFQSDFSCALEDAPNDTIAVADIYPTTILKRFHAAGKIQNLMQDTNDLGDDVIEE
ncbi:uncharacterized protein PHALS_14866 [Plasmopara halstedii]|uniref:Uncharacterized protein n=1 Tax=Plasmopara halstedii TaxID=4781 RepID=A0A0P1A5W3_PLAHL|nr:uncharacterized protein PHALS_14866 [Plasmopara halstedii]CEG35944.1 hypothetical protein PHALS_14866 [Plasmopara halstedii]|eukprot:XP_024572313.1 hypothetical protein PHALS_14866 [Plasmopara halstedii]